jgi:transposase
MNQWLTGWKAEFPYLVESPSQTLQQVNKHLHAAFNKFFRNKAEFPKPNGIACFAILSDGTFYALLNSFKKREQRLKKYQRRMAHKTKYAEFHPLIPTVKG